jgi:hypothetical protein
VECANYTYSRGVVQGVVCKGVEGVVCTVSVWCMVLSTVVWKGMVQEVVYYSVEGLYDQGVEQGAVYKGLEEVEKIDMMLCWVL